TGSATFAFKSAGATTRVALLVEVSSSKKVCHEVRHITRTENRESLPGPLLHQGSVIPHRNDIASHQFRRGSFQQIDLRFSGSGAKGVTGLAGIFERDKSLFRIARLKGRRRWRTRNTAQVSEHVHHLLRGKFRPAETIAGNLGSDCARVIPHAF